MHPQYFASDPVSQLVLLMLNISLYLQGLYGTLVIWSTRNIRATGMVLYERERSHV
jgi:hypothetical protein